MPQNRLVSPPQTPPLGASTISTRKQTQHTIIPTPLIFLTVLFFTSPPSPTSIPRFVPLFSAATGLRSNHCDSSNSRSIIPIQSFNCRFVNSPSKTSKTLFCPVIFRRTPSFHDDTIRNVAPKITCKDPRCGCAATSGSSVLKRYVSGTCVPGILVDNAAISR